MGKKPLLLFQKREEWRSWLNKNHLSSDGIWLIYYKKHTGKERIQYDHAVEEALCFGWIDSIVKSIDEDKYMQKFTPRRDKSNWSELNKARVKKLIKEGVMTESGLLKINAAKKNGSWDRKIISTMEFKFPNEFKKALKNNKKAGAYFDRLPSSHKKRYIGWIGSAKKEETREKRIKEAIELLESGKNLGMK